MPDSAGKKRNYREGTTKHYSSMSDEDIAFMREKYKNGVPPEIIDHLAWKLAGALVEEGRCGEILGED